MKKTRATNSRRPSNLSEAIKTIQALTINGVYTDSEREELARSFREAAEKIIVDQAMKFFTTKGFDKTLPRHDADLNILDGSYKRSSGWGEKFRALEGISKTHLAELQKVIFVLWAIGSDCDRMEFDRNELLIKEAKILRTGVEYVAQEAFAGHPFLEALLSLIIRWDDNRFVLLAPYMDMSRKAIRNQKLNKERNTWSDHRLLYLAELRHKFPDTTASGLLKKWKNRYDEEINKDPSVKALLIPPPKSRTTLTSYLKVLEADFDALRREMSTSNSAVVFTKWKHDKIRQVLSRSKPRPISAV